MSDDGQPVVDPLILRARLRARERRLHRAFSVIVSLMFVSALAGFCWGVCDEVRSAPNYYASVKAPNDASFLQSCSVRLANQFAEFYVERHSAPPPEPPVTTSINGNPRRAAPTNPRNGGNPRVNPVTGMPEPPDTDPTVTDPKVTFPNPPDNGSTVTPLPVRPNPPSVKPLPLSSSDTIKRWNVDTATADMLEKAHKAFDTAWGYHMKSLPDAPQDGRDAATRSAVKYFRESKALYEAVLGRRPPADLERAIDNRLVDLNALLYWSLKHMRVQ